MPIVDTNVLKDPTYVDPTGGSAVALNSLGGEVGIREVYFDGNLPLTRGEATFTSKEEKVKSDAPNGYTQPRRAVVIRSPITLANGNQTVLTLRAELAVDVEASITQIDRLRLYMSQVLCKSQFDSFWRAGSTD